MFLKAFVLWITTQAYKRHDSRVRGLLVHTKKKKKKKKKKATKPGARARFLELDITTLGKQGKGEELWRRLCEFLDLPLPSETATAPPFPHRFVFRYSALDQPRRQLGYIVVRWVGTGFRRNDH